MRTTWKPFSNKTKLTFLLALTFLFLFTTNSFGLDFKRGIENYRAIISKQKDFNSLSREEKLEVLQITKLLKQRSGFGSGGCDSAHQRCVNECDSVSLIYDYDKGDYVQIFNSDFSSNCEDACQRGRSYCENEDDNEGKCYEFKRACNNECPSDVYDYNTGNYLFLTDAEDICEDACRSGERACE